MEKQNEIDGKTTMRAHPRKNANAISALLFLWTRPLLRIGRKREFKTTDIGEPLKEYDSRRLGETLAPLWSKQLSESLRSTKKKPSLWSCISSVFGWEILGYAFCQSCVDLIARLGQPLIIGKILNYFSPNSTVTYDEVKFWVAIFAVTIVTNAIIVRPVIFALGAKGLAIRASLSALIYRKLVKSSLSTTHSIGTGYLLNLLTNDVTRFDWAPVFVLDIVGGIPTLLILIYLLWSEMGIPAIIGLGVVLFFVPIQMLLARKSSTLTTKAAMRTDKRMQLMNEIFYGIQPIKMYAWEKKYAKTAEQLRKKEVTVLRKKAYYTGFTFTCSEFLSKMGFFVCVWVYAAEGNPITAEKLFAALLYFTVFEDYITLYLPLGVQKLVGCVISVRRIQEFLLMEEVESPVKAENHKENAKIILEKASAKWSSETPRHTLYGVSMSVHSGMLVSVIGKVGSGKSSLIAMVLGEMKEYGGEITVQGSISYASQEAWLFSGTVRNNIVFGLPMDPERYREVIRVCALDGDLRQFPDGDETLLGERGISVSGGQRARINLARAIYRNADIYLLDDPLSAVDSQVGKHIFENCVKNYLSNKIVLLCTHQLQYIATSDLIVIMEDGSIKAKGNYKDLKNSTGDLESFFVESTEEKTEDAEIVKQSTLNITSEFTDTNELEEEITSEGNVSWKIMKSYINAGCSPVGCMFIIAVIGSTQSLASGFSYWLSFWIDYEQNISIVGNTTFLPVIGQINHEKCIWMYGGLLVSFIVFITIETLSFFYYSMEASKTLHDLMFNTVSRATMRFFSSNPSGRVLNRFSKDMRIIDEDLPETLFDAIKCTLKVLGVATIVSTLNVWLICPVVLIGCILVFLRQLFIGPKRSLRRLEGVTRSPMCTHANATMEGLATIRSLRMSEKVINDFDNYLNANTTACYFSNGVTQALGFYLETICVIYILTGTFVMVFMDTGLTSGEVGLGTTQLMTLTFIFQWAVRQSTEVESLMTSVERVLAFHNVESEAALMDTPSEQHLPKGWPSKGNIEFDNLNLQYTPTGPLVLKKLNIIIGSGEKIGIVGRTGAGKSSIINALFRLHPFKGRIIIDGIDISSIGLQDLRSKISVIPQSPFVATGTLRYNLDPFEEFNDAQLWQALDEVKLKPFIEEMPGKLSSDVSEGGANFSVGQRQLICLARALLRRNKILVMDEATANMDTHTDHLIQLTIRQKFSNCTVLTVAHRLHSVMDSDRILVMENGSVVEFGSPYELLQNADSHLNVFVNQTGSSNAASLRAIADAAHEKKKNDFTLSAETNHSK